MKEPKSNTITIIFIIIIIALLLISFIKYAIFPTIKTLRNINDKFIENKKEENKDSFKWPTSNLASVLPIPDSLKGKIVLDTEDVLLLYIENINDDIFKQYKDECLKKGFTLNSEINENYFHSYDENNNELLLTKKNDIMIIKLDKGQINNPETDNSSNPNIRPEVKEIFDDYELLTEKYYELIKKSSDSNNDKELLNEYLNLGKDFIDLIIKIDKIENTEDANYE